MLFIQVNEFTRAQITTPVIILIAILSLALYVTLYLLRSIGLYNLAKRNGVKHGFMAWIPAVWVYVVFRLIKEYRVFNFSFDKCAVIFTVIFGVSAGLSLVYNFFTFFPYAFYFFEGGQITVVSTELGMGLITDSNFINHFNVPAINIICDICYYFSGILDLMMIVIEVFAFIALFKKFKPENYILFSVLAVLGLFPIFVFVIRKNKAINFNEYMRNRYYYNNPYGANPYANNTQPPRVEDPFDEYADKNGNSSEPFNEYTNKSDDPFEEFSDKNKR